MIEEPEGRHATWRQAAARFRRLTRFRRRGAVLYVHQADCPAVYPCDCRTHLLTVRAAH